MNLRLATIFNICEKKEKKPETGPVEVALVQEINATQARMLRRKLEKAGKTEEAFCEQFKIPALDQLAMAQINDGLKYAEET